MNTNNNVISSEEKKSKKNLKKYRKYSEIYSIGIRKKIELINFIIVNQKTKKIIRKRSRMKK